MKNNTRVIYYLEMLIKSSSRKLKGIKPKSVSELVSALQQAHDDKRARIPSSDGSEWLYISDMKVSEDDGYACILIHRTDKTVSDPTFYNTQTFTRRPVPKQDGEGSELSCHVLLSLDKTRGKNSHRILAERVTGLSISKLQRFFNFLLKDIAARNPAAYSTAHPDGSVDTHGNPRVVKYWPAITLRGEMSDELIGDLAAGSITGVELYTEQNLNQPFDSNAYTTEKRRSIVLKLSRKKLIPTGIDLLKDVFSASGVADYELAAVAFTTRDGFSRTARIYTDTVSVAQQTLYTKKAVIDGFSNPLPASSPLIDKEILKKMRGLT